MVRLRPHCLKLIKVIIWFHAFWYNFIVYPFTFSLQIKLQSETVRLVTVVRTWRRSSLRGVREPNNVRKQYGCWWWLAGTDHGLQLHFVYQSAAFASSCRSTSVWSKLWCCSFCKLCLIWACNGVEESFKKYWKETRARQWGKAGHMSVSDSKVRVSLSFHFMRRHRLLDKSEFGFEQLCQAASNLVNATASGS